MTDAKQTDKAPYWVGFDLGGTKMLATIFDKDFQPLGRRRRRTKGYAGAESGVKRIIDTLNEALDDGGINIEQVAGIGIGCPGPVDLKRGVVVDAVNLGWEDVTLRKILMDKLGRPTFVLNDVDAGVYGENRFGAAKGARTVIGLFPGTGIGGGCVYNGEILHGERISAMEIGHVQVVEDGSICGCGRRGCLETVASRLAIAAEVAKAAYRGDAPSILKSTETKLTDIRSGVLAKSVELEEQAVIDIIRIAAGHIGKALANIVSLIIPDVIVLGGGLVEAMPSLLRKAVKKSLDESVMPAFRGTYDLVTTKLGDDATVLGAASWASYQVLGND